MSGPARGGARRVPRKSTVGRVDFRPVFPPRFSVRVGVGAALRALSPFVRCAYVNTNLVAVSRCKGGVSVWRMPRQRVADPQTTLPICCLGGCPKSEISTRADIITPLHPGRGAVRLDPDPNGGSPKSEISTHRSWVPGRSNPGTLQAAQCPYLAMPVNPGDPSSSMTPLDEGREPVPVWSVCVWAGSLRHHLESVVGWRVATGPSTGFVRRVPES